MKFRNRSTHILVYNEQLGYFCNGPRLRTSLSPEIFPHCSAAPTWGQGSCSLVKDMYIANGSDVQNEEVLLTHAAMTISVAAEGLRLTVFPFSCPNCYPCYLHAHHTFQHQEPRRQAKNNGSRANIARL